MSVSANILNQELLRGTNAGAASSLTISYNNPSGTNLLVVFIMLYDHSVSSVTYDGQNMTQQEVGVREYLYTLIDPSTGVNDLVLSFTDEDSRPGVMVYSLQNVDTIKATKSQTGIMWSGGGTATLNIDSAAGDLVIDYFAWQRSAADYTPGDGQTHIDDDSPTRQISSYKEGEAASTDMTHTTDTNDGGNSHIGIVVDFVGVHAGIKNEPQEMGAEVDVSEYYIASLQDDTLLLNGFILTSPVGVNVGLVNSPQFFSATVASSVKTELSMQNAPQKLKMFLAQVMQAINARNVIRSDKGKNVIIGNVETNKIIS